MGKKTEPLPAEILIVDDFNNGPAGTNNLGGERGVWVDKPEAMDSDCVVSFDRKDKVGRQGYSLQLSYTVDSLRPSANGYWTKLNGLDARGYRWLVLSVKGNPKTKFTTQLKIELKNQDQIGVYEIKEITRRWKKIIIPLNQFAGITRFDNLTELTIDFEKNFVTSLKGELNIDNIYFSTEENPAANLR
ncbi:MAG: hypothetical protein ABII74_04805 [Elusimicrobiota bacterium]